MLLIKAWREVHTVHVHGQYKHVLFTSTSRGVCLRRASLLQHFDDSTPTTVLFLVVLPSLQSFYITIENTACTAHVPYQQLYSKFMQQCFMAHECTRPCIDRSHPLMFRRWRSRLQEQLSGGDAENCQFPWCYLCCDVAIVPQHLLLCEIMEKQLKLRHISQDHAIFQAHRKKWLCYDVE